MTRLPTNGEALAAAATWITESRLPFRAAFIGGSMAWADPDLPYDPASDIDCYLVVNGDPPDGKIGKIRVDGVLLDVSWLPWQQLVEAESHAVLASLLHFGRIVRDDTGKLTALQERISGRFTDHDRIATRLEDMRARIRNGLSGDSSHLPEPEQAMNWLFPATLATHIPLVAACVPLTVRKRFLAARRVMEPGAYEGLLALYGFDTVTPGQAQAWLDDTATLFDHTAPLAVDSARFWASDIHAGARPIAIGGSQELVDTGFHREALYWIIATRVRCLTVLNDAGKDTGPFMNAFTSMTRALDIATPVQRAVRSEAILTWVDAHEAPS